MVLRSIVTVPHTGSRFLADSFRRGGYRVAHSARAEEGTELVWYHLYQPDLPPPATCVTPLRSPILVLASHDQDGYSGTKGTLTSSYGRQLEYVTAGCRTVHLEAEDVLERAAAAIGADRVPPPGRTGGRDYELKHRLAERDLAPELWRNRAVLEWWLEHMAHVDAWYAERGYDIWWRP